MDTEAECRKHVAEFLVQAKDEPEREVRLIGMSKFWLRLAVQADQLEALSMKRRIYGDGIRRSYESANIRWPDPLRACERM